VAIQSQVNAVRLFLSYARADEDHRTELGKRLKILEQRGLFEVWDDQELTPGEAWRPEIEKQLQAADIIVMLISDEFFRSDFINRVELTYALNRHKTGDIRIIPVIVEHCLWTGSPIAEIQLLPPGGKPIASWGETPASRAEAYVQVAEQIRDVAIAIADRKKLIKVNERQETQEAMTDFLRMILPVVIPREERGHLYNLISKRTKKYHGRSSLRKELRNLRSMQLIKMKHGKNVGDIADEQPIDLADFVELTQSGHFWMGRMMEIEGIDPEQPAQD
jgi:hypothetical protein